MPGGTSCAVASCSSNTKITRKMEGHVTFFSFPKDPLICNEWIKRCQREDQFETKSKRICSKHFTRDDFEDRLKASLMGSFPKKLYATAVPSLRLPSKDQGAAIKEPTKKRKEVHSLLKKRVDKTEQTKPAEKKRRKITGPKIVLDKNTEEIVDNNLEETMKIEIKYDDLKVESDIEAEIPSNCPGSLSERTINVEPDFSVENNVIEMGESENDNKLHAVRNIKTEESLSEEDDPRPLLENSVEIGSNSSASVYSQPSKKRRKCNNNSAPKDEKRVLLILALNKDVINKSVTPSKKYLKIRIHEK